MDSSILNVFHDEPFDAPFNDKYTDTDFWSSEGDTLGLAETLHGILPISATEDATQLYANSLLKDDTAEMMQAAAAKQSRNMFGNDNYMEHSNGLSKSNNHMVGHNAFHTNSDDEDEESSDDEDEVALKMNEIHNMNFERLSQCSQHTFRSRTDSSSIGDYESHSSDYDDDNDDDELDEEVILQLQDNNGVVNNENDLVDSEFGLLAADDFDLHHTFKFPLSKNRTISTNTLGSDVDGLGLHIDTNNFDLAEFITKDDFLTESINDKTIQKTAYMPQQNSIERQHNKSVESDAESDIIVDVETVEIEDELNVKQKLLAAIASDAKTSTAAIEEDLDLTYVDNTKRDPEWCPTTTATKKSEQSCKASPAVAAVAVASSTTPAVVVSPSSNIQRNYPPMVPNKKQCDILKRKFGSGRGGKNLMAQRNAKLAAKKAQDQQKATFNNSTNSESISKAKGLSVGGKNLALLKHDTLSISEQSSEEHSTPIKQPAAEQQQSTKQEQIEESAKAVKRKLNLEEYKLRRSDTKEIVSNNSVTISKLSKLSNCNSVAKKCNSMSPKKMQMAAGKQIVASEAVKAVVQNLKTQTMSSPQQKTPTDPITEAKNKVLRMQELKKAQQIKILDSTLSAKVPRVTKLPPLKEIVKDTYPVDDDEQTSGLKGNPDYEEIIIVSVSCNTNISLPPKYKSADVSSRSLLKASVKLQLTTGSLLASIQNEVVKKTQETNKFNVAKCSANYKSDKTKTISDQQQHGEDKIIMHLRKDRIRQRTFSIGIQTDLIPEFPLLPFPKAVITHKSRERTRRQQKRRNYRQRSAIGDTNSRLSAYSSSERDSSRSRTRSRSRSRSRSADSSSSLERLRTGESNLANGGYSSRSSRRHRSSVSSSYSENEHKERRRRYSYKKRRTQRGLSSSSSLSTSSMSDYSTRSRSRTRSRSPLHRRNDSRSKRNLRHNNNRNSYVDRNVSQPAVEERRIVYVGRIEQETTKEMLRRKFLAYGNIKQVTIHFKDTGMKYGFVTYERSQDAFNAIDNSTRDPQISAYDVSFGGRRAFCRASYADLDNAGINTYQSFVYPQAQTAPKKEEDSFEALLLKVKAKLNANKTKTTTANEETAKM